MSIVKSLSVGNGDMFYIKHDSNNFSIIDCCLTEDSKFKIVSELKQESKNKSITRFISTHPDEDHIRGLDYLRDEFGIVNFYCVENGATKTDESNSFKAYCELRDDIEKAFYLFKGCSRKWMNEDGEDKSGESRGGSGIVILWPEIKNLDFKVALASAKDGGSPNNTSPIIKYELKNGASFLWMGDLETEFLESIANELNLPKVHILFAPHHGRRSGKIPDSLLKKMNPDIIVVGEANSSHLNYYQGYNTITQNSAGDITFSCEADKVHIYVSSDTYFVDYLNDEGKSEFAYYIGTLKID